MIHKSTLLRWFLYVGIIVLCTSIGGDFGMAAGLFLCFMIHNTKD